MDTKTGVVIVLSWFGKKDTLACVESLLQGPIPARVLVVDNGSFDGVLEAVAQRWPEVAVLQTGANLGYSGGMNRGIRWALENGADYITVLNNDTVLPAGGIAALQARAEGGIVVSPEIVYRDRPDEIWFGGAVLDDATMSPVHARPEGLEPFAADGIRSTPLLAGCCVTASAQVWQRVGMFDERFFLNFEDSEWSVRARSRGVELAVDGSVRVKHAVSASFRNEAALLGTFYFVRNGLLFNRLAGGSALSRLRFLRRRGFAQLRTNMREGRHRLARREAVVGLWGAACYALGSYGPAPARLQRLVTKWRR